MSESQIERRFALALALWCIVATDFVWGRLLLRVVWQSLGFWEEKIVPGDCFFGCRGLGCEGYGLVGGFIRWPYG